jgi:hypothetical protein
VIIRPRVSFRLISHDAAMLGSDWVIDGTGGSACSRQGLTIHASISICTLGCTTVKIILLLAIA